MPVVVLSGFVMDGLAAMSVVLAVMLLVLFVYFVAMMSHYVFSDSLNTTFVIIGSGLRRW